MRLTTTRPRRENLLRNHTGFALITCTFALLTWALPTFGHDTPDIRSGVEKHLSPEEVQQIVYDPRNSPADYINYHWHQVVSGPYERQIGGWLKCIADSYDPETDEYGRWDEETYSWDESGCEDENTSEDSSTTTPADEESSSTASATDEDSQNEEVAGNTPTDGTITAPTDEELSTTTPTDEEPSATTPANEDSQNEEADGNTPTDGTTTAPTDEDFSSTAPTDEDISSTAPTDEEPSTTAPTDEEPSTTTPTDEEPSTTTPIQTLVETSGEEEDSEQAFGFAGAVEDQAYTAETAITALVMPDATGGEGEVTYRVFGLPAGLSFDAATRTISGTPTAATDGAVEVACLAEDSTGALTLLFFSITVNPPLSFGDFG